ncbi:aspartokinase domain-containing protein, partial [mine drainage metagenome]
PLRRQQVHPSGAVLGVPSAPEPSRPPSTADVTRAYIDEHPSIRDALQEDIVNFAFLARKIQTERGLRNEEAIEIALRRYQQEVRRQTPDTERVLQVLRDSRLEVHNRVALVRIKEDWQVLDRLYQIGRGLLPELKRRGVFQIYQGTRALTILCEDDLLSVLLEAIPPKNVLDVERGL